MSNALRIDRRQLIDKRKSDDQLFLILLSDQRVIINTEWEAMKIYTKKYAPKPIIEFLPADGRLRSQHGNILDNLLDSNYEIQTSTKESTEEKRTERKNDRTRGS